MILLYARHLVQLAVAAAVCVWLVGRFGHITAGVVWAAGAAVACGVGAVLLRTSPVGRVNWRNRTAAYLVPWGVRVGGGRLWPIPVVSWVVWIGVWAGAAVLTPTEPDPLTGWELAARIGLGAAWAIHGLALGHIVALGLSSRRPLITVVAILAGLITVSLLLHLLGFTVLALVVAGGPPLLIGGGYGVFVLVLLTAGRGSRWN